MPMRLLQRLEYAGSVEEAAREADLVIEAVPEEMESKIEIFTLLDKICRPTTILASNTSSLSVTEIASVTYRAKKCVGMHFFNPVHKMKLLEVVRALETDDDTLATAVEVGKRMKKEVVVIKESPGFHHQPHQCDDRQRSVLHAAGRDCLGGGHR
jgi:3-hydroxybutyryl-CoA dehydrogenase